MRAANTGALSAAAVEVTIHNHGCALPASAYGKVNRNGSGFHDGAPFVLRLKWSACLPQTSHP